MKKSMAHAFVSIDDPDFAQKLSGRINPDGLHKALDTFARQYCPAADELGLGYSWTIQQIECATDIIFKSLEDESTCNNIGESHS